MCALLQVKRSSTESSASKTAKKPLKPRRPSKAKSKAGPKKRKELKHEEEVFGEDDEDETPEKSRKGAKKTKKAAKGHEEAKPRSGPKNQLRRKAASKVSYKEESQSEAGSSGSEYTCSDTEDSDISDWGASVERKPKTPPSLLSQNKRNSGELPSKSPGPPKAKSSSKKKNTAQPTGRGKIISSDDDDDDENEEMFLSPRGSDQWLEVYLAKEEKWVCVDCVHGMVNKPSTCFKAATKPFMYVVGIDNSGHVNDVTRRYDPEWMTRTRKRRVDSEWWEETLRPFRNPDMKREDREEAEVRT